MTAEPASNLQSLNGKEIRQVSSDITQSGAALHDALEREPGNRDARMKAAGANMESDFVESTVNQAIGEVEENIKWVDSQLALRISITASSVAH